MSYFPLFMELQGKLVLICGSGHHAIEKIQRLRPYGAQMLVLTEHPTKEILAMNDISVENHSFCEEDLGKYPVFVVTAEDYEENHRIAQLCRNHHVPVNAVDQQEDCDFIFPALLQKGPLSIGISSSGASPTAAIELRRRFEEQIPEHIDEILCWLHPTRAIVWEKISDSKERKRILRQIVQKAFDLDRVLTDDELEQLLS